MIVVSWSTCDASRLRRNPFAHLQAVVGDGLEAAHEHLHHLGDPDLDDEVDEVPPQAEDGGDEVEDELEVAEDEEARGGALGQGRGCTARAGVRMKRAHHKIH